jgi:hypothetical protein
MSTEAFLAPSMVHWFSPWKWCTSLRPWLRWTLLIVGLVVGYIEAPILVVSVIEHGFHRLPPYWEEAFEIVYAPVIAAYDSSPAVERFYTLQFEIADSLLDSLLGDD